MQACKNLQQQKIHIIIFYSYNYLFLESSRNYIGKIKQTKKTTADEAKNMILDGASAGLRGQAAAIDEGGTPDLNDQDD